MGGEGSGRKPDVLKMVNAQRAQIATVKGENIEIPNYSGVKKEVLKTGAVFADNSYIFSDAGVLSGSNLLIQSGSFIHYLSGTAVLGTIQPHGSIYFSGMDGDEKNTFSGHDAGINNIVSGIGDEGTYNTFVGWHSGRSNISGSLNVAIGTEALLSNISGFQNMAIGQRALYVNTTGSNNVSVGCKSLNGNLTGNDNIAIGAQALTAVSGASYNVAIGSVAGAAQLNGIQNIYIGYGAGYSKTGGANNILIGTTAGRDSTIAQDNVGIGTNALRTNTGSYNVAIGNTAGYTGDGAQCIFIGYSSGYYETGANKLMIDSQVRTSEAEARAKAIIYGIMAALPQNQTLNINASLNLSGGAFFIGNMAAPASNAGGGKIFVSGGALNYIGSSGTITQIAAA